MIRKILIIIILFTSTIFFAQRTSSSPYSYFGIGDEFSARTVEQNAMGGIGVAFSHYKYLNFTNPAAYAKLRYTTYSLGALNNDLTVKSGTSTQNSISTSLSYVALAFPVGKKAGFSLGMQPVSAVGYSLNNSSVDATGALNEISIYEGSGGLNRLYGSLGIQLFKEVAIGIEADFNFGNVENSITNQLRGVSLSTKYNETTRVRGGSIKIGTQIEKEFKNKLTINAGATVKLATDLSIKGNNYLYSLTFSGAGAEVPRDTVSVGNINGKFNLPIQTVLGLGVGKFDKWYAGVEYENQDAITTTGVLANTSDAYQYTNSDRLSIGGYYLPKINSISSYWDRVTYRAGVRLEKSGLLVDGSGNNSNFTEIKDFGISFGLGLPLKRLSTVNMGVEFGQRGTIENNLIQENYFNFRLSLSLTDTNWFVKRKID